MTKLMLETGETVELTTVLAKAGEGTIYEVAGHPDWVAKVFHPTLGDLQTKVDKVRAMITSPPSGAVQKDDFVVLTWPLHTVAAEGQVVGYVMPRIDTATAVEIHSLSNPSNRMNPLPSAPQWTQAATWFHLVNIAANLCLAVEAVHRVNAVIGDFQERNILVSDTTRVTLVDCDSMQFIDDAGHQFLCGVGRPEFTAPELASANLRTEPRGKPSDLFALAVHIHLLLMAGNHPFMRGEWTGGGEQPEALALARSGFWAGGVGSPLRSHPLAPSPTFLPQHVQQLFARAFTAGVQDPSARPSGTEWRQALQRVQVATCPSDKSHQYPVGTGVCPWCAIAAERQTRNLRKQAGAATAASAGSASAARGTAASQPTSSAPLTGPAAVSLAQPLWPVPPNPYRQPTTAPGKVRTRLAVLSAAVMVAVAGFIIWSFTPPGESAASSNGSSTAAVINAAAVGSCLRIAESGSDGDGGTEVDVSSAVCDTSRATDRVIMRTTDSTDCSGDWVRAGEEPFTVLCTVTE